LAEDGLVGLGSFGYQAQISQPVDNYWLSFHFEPAKTKPKTQKRASTVMGILVYI